VGKCHCHREAAALLGWIGEHESISLQFREKQPKEQQLPAGYSTRLRTRKHLVFKVGDIDSSRLTAHIEQGNQASAKLTKMPSEVAACRMQHFMLGTGYRGYPDAICIFGAGM
jgi:hypothetical protein